MNTLRLIDKLGLDVRTKISTIIAIGAYCNMILAEFNPSVIADNETAMRIYQVVSAIFALCAWINSHYYNQDFTPEARVSTIKMRDAKTKRLKDQPYVEEPEDASIEEEEVIANEVSN